MQWFRLFVIGMIILTHISAAYKGETPGNVYKKGSFPIIDVEKKPANSLRIASFNIRCADVNGATVQDRKYIVMDEIYKIDADSMGLQEVTEEWAQILNKMPDYTLAGEGRDGAGRGEGSQIIYSNKKYKCLDSGTFWLSETPDKPSMGWDAACPRICTFVKLENRKTGEIYAHVNSHFDHVGQVAVVNEAKMINSFIKEKFSGIPVVFTADMNSTTDSVAYGTMTENLVDTRLAADDVKSYDTFHDEHISIEGFSMTIDYILCAPETQALTYRTVTAGIDGLFVSDHFPIYSDLRFKK